MPSTKVPAGRAAGVVAPAARGAYDVAVLQKALDVLEVLADRNDIGLTELSSETGVSKASTFRVLSTLEARGFVSKDPVTRKYSAGVRLIALSCAVVERLDLVTAARPLAVELQASFDESVNVGIVAGHEVLYVDIVESDRGLRMAAKVGARHPIHSTALGKAILSAMPPDQARALLGGYRRTQMTPNTLVGLDALLSDVAASASRGYSIDDEENEVGARCIGAAIRDFRGQPIGAISVSGPAARIPLERAQAIGARVVEAAAKVEEGLGYARARAEVP